MLEELGIEKPRAAFARQHAKKAFAKCKHLFPLGFPSDVRKAIECVLPGFQVIGLDGLPQQDSGITNLDERLIGYNNKHPEVRIRFTLAHEMGHVCMEHEHMVIDEYQTDSSVFEKEANIFAGEFLVPKEALSEALKKMRDPKELARFFNVSREVILIRLQTPGLLSL